MWEIYYAASSSSLILLINLTYSDKITLGKVFALIYTQVAKIDEGRMKAQLRSLHYISHIKKQTLFFVLATVYPSFMWYLLIQLYSPWWLENLVATPLVIIPLYFISPFIFFLSSNKNLLTGLLLNLGIAIAYNGNFNNSEPRCVEGNRIFQFNIKYDETNLNLLAKFLIKENYDFIALHEVSPIARKSLLHKLNPYYPYFISGINKQLSIETDQLILSTHPLKNTRYQTYEGSSYLISTVWKLDNKLVKVMVLHPPSPRTEQLWLKRNQTLYQLQRMIQQSKEDKILVIGDLNISDHSARLKPITKKLINKHLNSWPNHSLIPQSFGYSIDQLWLSLPGRICSKNTINKLDYSDHYAIETKVSWSNKH